MFSGRGCYDVPDLVWRADICPLDGPREDPRLPDPRPADPRPQESEHQPASAPAEANSEAFREYFRGERVRILGTVMAPLFCGVDVAHRIDDQHYRGVFSEMKDVHVCKRHIRDGRGRLKEMHFLTEKGLYRYLLQSRRPLAAGFQDFVIDHLCDLRRKIVDDTILENSLLLSRLELSRHDTLVAQDVNDRSLKAYNDMMIENCKLRRENKTLADAQRASRPPPGPGEWSTHADKEAYYRYLSER